VTYRKYTDRHKTKRQKNELHNASPNTVRVKVKGKWSRYRSGVAQRVGRGIALLVHDRDTRRWWVVSSTPRPHFTPEKDPVHILQEAGSATGTVWTGGKSRPNRDSIPDRPARSSVAIPTELPGPQILPEYFKLVRMKWGEQVAHVGLRWKHKIWSEYPKHDHVYMLPCYTCIFIYIIYWEAKLLFT